MVHCSESNSSSQVQTKAFFYSAKGIVPRLGEDEFQIVTKLSACQISGTREKALFMKTRALDWKNRPIRPFH